MTMQRAIGRYGAGWAFALAALAIGWISGYMVVGGAVAVVVLCTTAWLRSPHSSSEPAPAGAEVKDAPKAESQRESEATTPPGVLDRPADSNQLVAQMIQEHREALLLRRQIAQNLDPEQLKRAANALDQSMSVVPAGDVLLHSWRSEDQNLRDPKRERLVKVEAIYLDRFPVTNRQFKQFVDAGGYGQPALWDAVILPNVVEFVDLTGMLAPRFWREGRYTEGLDEHPVVGVSWYEAAAYARWAGKRLPTDPEWVKAGAWPVLTQGTRPVQRRFPWGDTLDRNSANVWGSGPSSTVEVTEYLDGVSVGGAYQLVGNVWEWTNSDYGAWDATGRALQVAEVVKSVRGGAFDTYFDAQASVQFQSGEFPNARKHNIGFRCALGFCDIVSLQILQQEETSADLQVLRESEEVAT